MIKSQQFFILKFSSDRLRKSNYNIDISFKDARKNSEIVTINNSALLRALFRYKNINFDQNELDNLLISNKKLKKLANSEENRERIAENSSKIEKSLYVEDLVSIEFSNKAHYLTILKKHGFYINGTRFVPFLASAGMIRRNTAMFINNNIKHPFMDLLENSRDEKVPMTAAKYGAYFSLYSSSTLPVSFPSFAVVPDKEIEAMRRVSLIEYQGTGVDDKVTEADYPLKTNAWDGQGLISPRLAEQWSKELEMDYTFSCAIIRAPFIKGLVVTFDTNAFATKIAKKYTFVDLYGEEQDIRKVDLIISESMFKLPSNSYKNTKDFVEKCHANHLGFGISKVNSKKEKSYSRTSYQFLQVLDLDEMDIANLCEPTLSWFRNIGGNSAEDMLLYAMGESSMEPKDFNRLDATIKALLINPELANDRYIQNKFIKTIGKKKKESYMGGIFVNANYQFMVADPFYQACHIFGLENISPLLKDGEHYSEYWQKQGVVNVSAIRSPIVHHSELNILNLQDREDTKLWFEHIHSGVIFPANGIGMDCAIHGGADFDGDLICTINNHTIAKGRMYDVPIVYNSQKLEKTIVDSRNDAELVAVQLNGYNSKVGFATNISSSFYTMLEEFQRGTPEYDVIANRLKIGRAIQGEIIDGVKGLKVPPFREHWTKATKITDEMTTEEKEKWKLYNHVACKVRPAFFRFLYPNYMRKYNAEIKKYDIYCHLKFGLPFTTVYKSPNPTADQQEIIAKYRANSFFLDNQSTVNMLSHFMRMRVSLTSKYSKKLSEDFDYYALLGDISKQDVYSLSKMKEYLQEYKAFKKRLREGTNVTYDSMPAFVSYLRKECFTNISSNESELADYAIMATYGGEISMVEFPWEMFSSGILMNLLSKSPGTVSMPVQDENGDVEYLWNRYTFREFALEDIYA